MLGSERAVKGRVGMRWEQSQLQFQDPHCDEQARCVNPENQGHQLSPTLIPTHAPSHWPQDHLKTDWKVGHSWFFIFFMKFLNSLFFLSHL